ncbi:hypothetical protein G6M04_30080 [Agrobacterium rhizogenes]|uniref:calcium-binding protein n=1 Tax=Rhizobium rhizogenes TaxID=359 RepID=UPI001571A551|nr:calcium-binding protein [Rhizobium rhizogenes]NTG51653.1 hypothetical protein [Rhizobium rhizogenes]
MLTSKEVTALFLYGTSTKPDDLIDPNLIRDSNVKTPFIVNKDDYMMNGPGRFASPALFEVVQLFFAAPGITLAPGTYTESAIRGLLGTNEAIIRQQQWAYSDGIDDFAERVYVWNSVAFEIDDRAQFVVDADGTRHIDDFAIIPYSNTGVENFNFESRDPIASLGNGYLRDNIDPWNIGREVNISFSDGRTLDSSFTFSDFQNSASNLVVPNPFLLAFLPSAMNGIIAELRESGVSNFVDEQGRAIIFGTDKDDHIDELWAGVNDQILEAAKVGLVVISGAGNDTITAGDNGDYIDSGDGNDIITGGLGDDYLEGGDGNDTIYANDNELPANSEKDTILAGAGDDVVYINGSGVVSLGAGDDEIHISSSDGGVLGLARSSSEEAPAHAIIWGGEGADSFYFDKAAHVLAVNVDSVTEELLKNISVDAIFEYFNRNYGIGSPYQYILVNVDETDKLFLEGSQITSSSSIREEQFHHTENFNYQLLEQFYEDGYFPGNDKDYFPYPFEDTYPENHDFFHWEQRGDATPYNGELPELFPYGVYPDAWKLFAPTAVRDLVEDYYHRYFEMSGSGIPIYVGAGKYGANITISSETGGYFSLDGFVDGWAGITITGNDSEYYTKMTLTSQAIDIKTPGTQQDSLSYHQYEPEDDSLFNPNLPTFDPSLPRYGHHYLVPREYRTVGEPVVTEKTTESDEMLKPDGYDSAYTPTVDLSQFVLTRENGTSDDDTLVGGNRKQSFNGGDGSDTVDYSASTSGIFVDLSTGTGFDGDADGDEFVSIENIIGTSFADTLYGNDAANVLSGKDGNDGLSSGAGDDMLFGGLGDDWFDGGTGNDTIYGGAGSLDEVDYNGSLQEYSFTRNADNSVTIVSERWGADTLFDVEQIWLYSEDWSSYEVYNLIDLAPELPVANTILGTSGDDHLVGTTGDDVIDSLGGNDYVNGGEGNDTYLYSVNDGDEYIDDEAGSITDIDVLRFADLNYADVAFSHDSASSNLVLTVNSTNHLITLDEQYYSSSEGWGLEKVEFADGITVDLRHSDEVWTYHGSTDDDHIVGAIWGKQDVFQGGHGNDYLSGEAGSDTYVYAKGDGSDLIDDNAGFTVEQGNTDVLQLADLNQSELTFSRNGDDLQISVNETGETITVDRQFQSTEQDWGVEKIEFADGSSWDLQDIWDETAPGSSENNVVVMNSAASTAASQADTSAELASADIITFPTASITVERSDDSNLANDDIIITEAENTESPTYSADIISLEDFVANHQSGDQNSDLWFEPEPIGALI